MVYVLLLEKVDDAARTDQLLAGFARVMGGDAEMPSVEDRRREFDQMLAAAPDSGGGSAAERMAGQLSRLGLIRGGV